MVKGRIAQEILRREGTLIVLRRLTPTEIGKRYAGPLTRIYLEDFDNLEYGYPKVEGVKKIVWRGSWFLVRGIRDPESNRLYFSWRRPLIVVKARSVRA